eukprot:g17162.t1
MAEEHPTTDDVELLAGSLERILEEEILPAGFLLSPAAKASSLQTALEGFNMLCKSAQTRRWVPEVDGYGFTFIDLFAGIGGFRLALEKLGGLCLGSCELDKFARQTYELNFSKASRRKLPAGWCYGQPIGAPIRIFEEEVFSGLGKIFQAMLRCLRNSGYEVQYEVLDAKHHLPQNRPRVYIVGAREDQNFEFDRATAGADGVLEQETHPDGSGRLVSPSHPHVQTLCSSYRQRFYLYSQFVVDDDVLRAGEGELHKNETSHTAVAAKNYPGDESYAVVQQPTMRRFKSEQELHALLAARKLTPRFFTPRECCRIMGFPEEFEYPQGSEGEEGRFYHQIGNAVVPGMVAAVCLPLVRHIVSCSGKDAEGNANVERGIIRAGAAAAAPGEEDVWELFSLSAGASRKQFPHDRFGEVDEEAGIRNGGSTSDLEAVPRRGPPGVCGGA